MLSVTAANGFAALGAEPRLEILRLLVRAGPKGISVGRIQQQLGIPASTMAHHLRILSDAGLVEQVKEGRSVINRANFVRVEALAAFLTAECCVDAVAPEFDGVST